MIKEKAPNSKSYRQPTSVEILGEYIGRIMKKVRRTRFIVEHTKGFEGKPDRFLGQGISKRLYGCCGTLKTAPKPFRH
jgi:hypothetical protein